MIRHPKLEQKIFTIARGEFQVTAGDNKRVMTLSNTLSNYSFIVVAIRADNSGTKPIDFNLRLDWRLGGRTFRWQFPDLHLEDGVGFFGASDYLPIKGSTVRVDVENLKTSDETFYVEVLGVK